MVEMQSPRLTTTLRAFNGHLGTIHDVDQLYLERKILLKMKSRERSLTFVGASVLAQRLIPHWDEAPAHIQHTYEEYLSAVGELVDGELSTEELHESAEVVYDILCDNDTKWPYPNLQSTINKKKEQFLDFFRHISSDIDLHKVAELAGRLHNWATSFTDSFPLEGMDRSDNLDQVEFGADLDFHAPSLNLDGRMDTGEDDDKAKLDHFGTWDASRGQSDLLPMNIDSIVDAGEFGAANDDLLERMNMTEYGKANLRWFKELCNQIAFSGAGAQFSGDELALALICVLDSDGTGDEISGELFDLVGDAGFDQIQKILWHRKEIVDLVHKGLMALKSGRSSGSPLTKMPTYGTQVSVQTNSGRQLEKLRRKEEKRNFRRGLGCTGMIESELDWLASVGGFSALVDAAESSDGILANLIAQGDDMTGFAGTALPQGSVRKAFKGYEEVKVPAAPTAPLKPEEYLVEIADLDDFAQTAFKGYKTLNRIQSELFKTAYYSNENILVCAPTGAGKTNIAMITVLHEIGQHFKYGVLQKTEFKIVYVAPMKALAAEVTSTFSHRLAPLNVVVKELTGDMQLTKRELEETQMIVTTPEKWDVITRKSSDVDLAMLVKLLIIDEVHLLNDDRGPVIEALVARTLRQVESTQSMIRIVGLSATLPNYVEVARFLGVNLEAGLFFFNASYRPIPLTQQYIGVTETNYLSRNHLMNEICYKKVLEAVKRGQQAMVFVHSRKDTGKTARILVEIAQTNGELGFLSSEDHPQYGLTKKEVGKSRNRELGELFQSGFGIHHAGMLRSDRNLTEQMFSSGLIKVLVCTATLAWGINLPAHTVVIKGTQLYDPKAGGWRELGMLDVMQIFGRAGRPQFDKSGEGIIITTHDKLAYYLRLLTHQLPIESQFISALKDNLNAEVVLGTVTNLKEASIWLGYTYLFVRMPSNPLAYGMTWKEVAMDPSLTTKRKALLIDAARALDKAKMLRFDEKSGNLYATSLGRVASHFYIQYRSVETYNEMLKCHMNDSELINLVAQSSEFENIMVREEEQLELENLRHSFCHLEIRGGPEDKIGKINILIQVYISRGTLEGFSLIADSAYISASLGRIMRALFEICLHQGWCSMAALLLDYCKAVDRQIWPHQHALRQFDRDLSHEILHKLEDREVGLDRLYDMDEKEIGALIRHPHGGKMVMECLHCFPCLHLSANISPITRTVLQVTLTITPDFVWKERYHGTAERWWIWVEDSENEHIYHSEHFILTKKMMNEGGHTISFTIPIFEPLPPQYYIRVISDGWLHAEAIHTVSFQHLILPEVHSAHTELLDLRPLPVTALGNKLYESLYTFSHFNPIQTQVFHILYHTNNNVLLGAPTGSGKTISAEVAMLRLFNTEPEMKVLYIAPLKALVRERLADWKKGLAKVLHKRIVELTGDFTPDLKALDSADIIVSTPEKWDGISRNWQNRSYIKKVGIIIIDEIHLLGGDRGPVLEVIVSRMRYISSQTENPVRFVGLSTALANARDLANWLGIGDMGLFNFKPSVRPVPLEVHIQGYPGKFYCPRMKSMNKPAYASIMTHSPFKPVLIFVSSRRQTRLTALDLIQFANTDENPRQFLHMSEDKLEMIVSQIADTNLKHTLQFGIGLHHAGLNDQDRSLVEELFTNNKIQVLVSTSTLAWGVNLPAHMVIIKGTEYYDGKSKQYVDFPITDVLQMMGRAGRPQYDQHGKAVILVHDPKKSFYKKFLYEPFPVESSLHHHLHDHFNAEIAAGTIASKQDAIDYLTWTYLFRRLIMNPSYYGLENTASSAINSYLSNLVSNSLQTLDDAGCVRINEDGTVDSLALGTTAANYYLKYTTVSLFSSNIGTDTSIEELMHLLSNASEYDELPVRHNEEELNAALAKEVQIAVDSRSLDDPHIKTNLLLQAHFMRLEVPITDYVTDTKSVLDQSIRILQAMVDIAANADCLRTTINAFYLLQMVVQGMWFGKNDPLWMLPNMSNEVLDILRDHGITNLLQLLQFSTVGLHQILQPVLTTSQLSELIQVVDRLPRVEIRWRLHQNAGKHKEGFHIVDIQLNRNPRNRDTKAFAPFYPKVKDEGWWVLLGNLTAGKIHALKRVCVVDHITTSLVIPSNLQETFKDITLSVISDCYLGLDQHYNLGDFGPT